MRKLPQIAAQMQKVLNEEATEAGYVTGFVQRESKMTGAKFTQTLVFGWMAKPEASYAELTQTAAAIGLEIRPQGLYKRFTEEAAECLRRVLAKAVTVSIKGEAVEVSLLKKFSEVRVLDSSIVNLPDEIVSQWLGYGSKSSAVKLDVGLDLVSGTLLGPYLRDGRSNDCSGQLQHANLPEGSLRLADLGYFDSHRLRQLDEQGVYWISRLHPKAYLVDSKPSSLVDFLRNKKQKVIDLETKVGKSEQVPCRLLAVRAPKEVVLQRQARIREKARHRKNKTVNRDLLALAQWTVFVTNADAQLLSLDEVLVLARARWQIELLFKLWKSHGRIDQWRSDKSWHILCEFYAKLLAMLIQHWILIVSSWRYPDRSLFQAAQAVQKIALSLVSSLNSTKRLLSAINLVGNCIRVSCRINKRRKAPSNFQLLLNEALG